MISLKNISWVKHISNYSDTISYALVINNITFLSIIEIGDDTDSSILSAFSGRKDGDKYYIHITSNIFDDVKGNDGIKKWGWFNDLEKCKKKAEEILTEKILSFIDIRNYKIEELLNGNN